MKFKILFLMAILVTTLFTGCNKTEDESNKIEYPPLDESKKVIIGIDDNFAPFSFKDEKLGQGRDKAKEYLTEHPEILEEVETLVRQKLAEN